jgi:carboxypeptidase Taq
MSKMHYDKLLDEFREIAYLNSVAELLAWDQRVMMPSSAGSYRAEQNSFISGLVHEKLTNPKIGELISKVESSDLGNDPMSDMCINLRQIKKIYTRAVQTPADLVKAIVHAQSVSLNKWTEARDKNDFKVLEGAMSEVINLLKQQADIIGYKNEPYDAILDEHETEITTEEVANVMLNLEKKLVPIIQILSEKQSIIDDSILKTFVPIEQQHQFCCDIIKKLGLLSSSTRLDVSVHPFSVHVGPLDSRISCRYFETDLKYSFLAVLHEAGHAIYNQGLPADYFGLPQGSAISSGFHESQSRLWENMVGRSFSFWEHFFPILVQLCPDPFSKIDIAQFWCALNKIRIQLNRVGADEITYNLHILVRFEIERDLFAGRLHAKDIPDAWRAGYLRLLGIEPDNDFVGCLQDIQWGRGAFGYFPTYSLGNIYAAQLFHKAQEDIATLHDDFRSGNFYSLREWLRLNVHQWGQKYPTKQMIERATGEPLTSAYLINDICIRYGEIYGLDLRQFTCS